MFGEKYDCVGIQQIGVNYVPVGSRVVEELDFESFFLAEEGRMWQSREDLHGMTILQYPRAIMIRCAGGKCVVIRQKSTKLEHYFEDAVRTFNKAANS